MDPDSEQIYILNKCDSENEIQHPALHGPLQKYWYIATILPPPQQLRKEGIKM